eukprot:c6208_g1_i1 orf=1-237(-)
MVVSVHIVKGYICITCMVMRAHNDLGSTTKRFVQKTQFSNSLKSIHDSHVLNLKPSLNYMISAHGLLPEWLSQLPYYPS